MAVPSLIVETVTVPHPFNNHFVGLHAKLEAVVTRADSVASGELTPERFGPADLGPTCQDVQ